MQNPDLFNESHRASYSPEDNKCRLYVGRVPRAEYEALRAEGWTSTPKQDCDFVAHWTPERRDTCLSYAGIIEDEDQSPEDRAADRAERFAEYRDKRTDEATGAADRYDAGPSVHGYQSQARGERAARRHDRHASHACDAWSKAEYWQRRTAGVISHALYVCRPDVRMGRIKTIESEQRKHAAHLEECAKTWRNWTKLAAMEDAAQQTAIVTRYTGSTNDYPNDYKHPRPETVTNASVKENGSSLWTLLTMKQHEYGTDDITGAEACALWFARHAEPQAEDDWSRHYALRLAYEWQMLEAQGGRAAMLEMEVGGWVGNHQIRKVNKSNATGRVVSVAVSVPTHGRTKWGGEYPAGIKAPTHRLETITVERMGADIYRPPTDEDKAALIATKKAEKATTPKADPCPLINPTDDDAQRLVDVWNERERETHNARKSFSDFEPAKVIRLTQAQYSANSQGAYARAETRTLHRDMMLARRSSNMWTAEGKAYDEKCGKPVCKVRTTHDGKSCGFGGFPTVIVITDKPQKPFPAAVWSLAKAPETEAIAPEPETEEIAQEEPGTEAPAAPEILANGHPRDLSKHAGFQLSFTL